jgi:hypothetical protein
VDPGEAPARPAGLEPRDLPWVGVSSGGPWARTARTPTPIRKDQVHVEKPSTHHSKGVAAVCLAVAAVALAVPASALGAVNVTRAELKFGQLRVEDRGALPGATITTTSDSTATGRADGAGAFRVEASGYASSTCRAIVSDGSTSTQTTLAECTPSVPAPSPTPTPTPIPAPSPSATLVIVDDVLPSGNVGSGYSGYAVLAGRRRRQAG